MYGTHPAACVKRILWGTRSGCFIRWASVEGRTEGFPSFMSVLFQYTLTAIKANESLQLVTFILFIFLWTWLFIVDDKVRWSGYNGEDNQDKKELII